MRLSSAIRSARTLTAALVLAPFGLSSIAWAQVPEITVLARQGDVLPTGEVVTNVAAQEIGDEGTWAALLEFGSGTVFNRALVVDGSIVLKTGDTVQGGATLRSLSKLGVSRTGQVVVLLSTESGGTTTSRVLVDGTQIVAVGDFIPTPQGPLEVHTIRSVDYDEGTLFMSCKLWTATGLVEATWYGDATPSSLVDQVVWFEGDVMLGTSLPFLEGGLEASLAGARTTMGIKLDGPSGPVEAIFRSGIVVAEDGGPGPVPGSTWDFGLGGRGRTSGVGWSLIAGQAAVGGGVTESFVVYNGNVLAREGQPLPGLPGETVSTFTRTSLFLTDDGLPIFSVPLVGGGGVTMVGEFPLIRSGDVLAGGQVVDNVGAPGLAQTFDATSDGRTLIQRIGIAGIGPTLVRIDRGPADPVACTPVPNATGLPGRIEARGSRSISQNDLTITATSLPQSTFGYLITSRTAQTTPMAGGIGTICLGGSIGRYVDQVGSSGTTGRITTTIDWTAIPQPTGFVNAVSGETWFFQMWHRDSTMGSATSNFTEAVQVVLD